LVHQLTNTFLPRWLAQSHHIIDRAQWRDRNTVRGNVNFDKRAPPDDGTLLGADLDKMWADYSGCMASFRD
jgi:hypothetical protein